MAISIPNTDIRTYLDLMNETFDLNGDGYLTKQELGESEAQKADLDGDGYTSEEEYQRFEKQFSKQLPESIRQYDRFLLSYHIYHELKDKYIAPQNEAGPGCYRQAARFGSFKSYYRSRTQLDPASRAKKEYDEGRLGDFALAIESESGTADPEAIEELRAMEMRFQELWDEKRIDSPTEADREKMLAEVETLCHDKSAEKLKIIRSLSLTDLKKLYDLTIIATFFDREEIKFEPGAGFTQLVEDKVGDCNIFSTMVFHLAKKVEIDGLDLQNMPVHACVKIELSGGVELFFDNAKYFEFADQYQKPIYKLLDGEMDPPKEPWQCVAEIHKDQWQKLAEDDPHAAQVQAAKAIAIDPDYEFIRYLRPDK